MPTIEQPTRRDDAAAGSGWRSGVEATILLCASMLTALPAAATAPAPIKLAVFDYELEDYSAGADYVGVTPADSQQLAHATDQVRQLFARTDGYSLVDVGTADAAEAKAHTLRDCDGCDAAIARKLGAERSMVGVVRRISRTEYVVRFYVRDTQTGAVVAAADSGLRMGTNDSWGRGATRLIKNQLLEVPTRQ